MCEYGRKRLWRSKRLRVVRGRVSFEATCGLGRGLWCVGVASPARADAEVAKRASDRLARAEASSSRGRPSAAARARTIHTPRDDVAAVVGSVLQESRGSRAFWELTTSVFDDVLVSVRRASARSTTRRAARGAATFYRLLRGWRLVAPDLGARAATGPSPRLVTAPFPDDVLVAHRARGSSRAGLGCRSSGGPRFPPGTRVSLARGVLVVRGLPLARDGRVPRQARLRPRFR